MFGGIAAGADRLYFATFDGNVVAFDVESGDVNGQFTLYPSGPERSHISVCAVAADGTLLLGDTRGRRIRRYSTDGRQLQRIGGRANPSIREEDGESIVTEPCAILAFDDRIIVGCGGLGMEHGVQCFDAGGEYQFSFEPPEEGWKRCQGVARLDGSIWVAETEGGAIREHELDGSFRRDVELHPDLRRPFRIAPDGYGRVLMVLAPESEEQQEAFGVARLASDGAFEGWTVRAGEQPGQVYCPFDLAVLGDGRFVVADLPLGGPPDVRVQLFSADGRLLRVVVEDTVDLTSAQKAWFETLLAREADPYEQARVHHYYAGATPEHLEQARDLYRAALAREPGHLLARLGLAALLEQEEPAAAEEEYRAALEAGGGEGEILARIAACRRAAGDLDGAIQVLKEAVEAADPPEEYHARIEDLGTYYLERAGETP